MRNRTFKRAVCALLALLLLPVSAFAVLYGAGETAYTNSWALASGLTYTNTVSYTPAGLREESYMLELAKDSDIYPIVLSCDTIYGGMTISDLVKYGESLGYNVVAAVNTDLFSTANHVPLGAVIENGQYKSSPEGAPVVCFREDGTAFVSDSPDIAITLTNQGGAADGTANAGKTVSLTHFNKVRNDMGGLYLLDSSFSTVSTRTTTDGWMVRMKILDGSIKTAGKMTLEVTELYEGSEEQPIGDGYMILTAGTLGGYNEVYSKFAVGDVVTLETACTDAALSEAAWATGAADILAEKGVITDAVNTGNELYKQNPRTALGIKDNGTIVTYVIDGRRSAYSNGLTYTQLVNELLSMGCTTVVNFDGGGSSAMSVRLPGYTASTTLNLPSDGNERRCATYMLYVTDTEPDGEAQRLFLEDDGAFILAGASLNLAYLATDSGYKSVSAPENVTAKSAGLGKIEGTVYTAGDTAGADAITLSAKSGANGAGTLHIITDPDAVSVINAATGKTVTALKAARGEQVQLVPSCTYMSRTVISEVTDYTFTVTGDIGTVSEDGVFTAGSKSDTSGSIAVSCGTKTYTIDVTIPAELEDIDTHWSRDYVLALSDAGIVKGTTPTTYEPDREIKRGDFILMLYRAAGQPVAEESAEDAAFTDVPADAYYASAIAWAQVKGIAKGAGDGTFEPEKTLSRQQAFTFAVRSLGILGVEYAEGTAEDLAGFSDADSVADYAVVPTATLYDMGIVGGSDGCLTPEANLTRGQMAKVLSMVLGLTADQAG